MFVFHTHLPNDKCVKVAMFHRTQHLWQRNIVHRVLYLRHDQTQFSVKFQILRRRMTRAIRLGAYTSVTMCRTVKLISCQVKRRTTLSRQQTPVPPPAFPWQLVKSRKEGTFSCWFHCCVNSTISLLRIFTKKREPSPRANRMRVWRNHDVLVSLDNAVACFDRNWLTSCVSTTTDSL